nr:DNA methyltransferase [uncultured Flavobacterium sp.]
MNIAQIEVNLQNLITNFTNDTFIYELLLAYGLPRASITRLQKGNLNLSKIEGEISWKKKLFFKPVFNQDLHLAITEIKNTLKQDQRFVIVTDFKTLLAIDTKTTDSLDIDFTALPKHFDFFLPWAGMEKATHQNENPADVKAAEKMAKLFDEIKKDNPENSPEFIHGLNVFLSRLLFCFFAEDTGIYKLGQFTNAIASHTQTDGNDLNQYLNKLFDILNTHESKRTNLPIYLNEFPYVNGGLFQYNHPTPTFTRRSRQAIIDAGELNWSAINPDIFGSMFQAVISPEHRGGLGAHYTSVPNIMKVIEPLFLNELKEEFETAKGNIKKLTALLGRLQNIKIFDPACGSGNFLIIAYKELRRLEIVILNELNILKGKSGSGSLDFGSDFLSNITLNNFYGIEIDDFAYEVAKLALWLAEHQMNQDFFKAFGKTNPTLPLKDAGQITKGNATRLDWEAVCPKNEGDEIYILGNPPYLGFRNWDKTQKEDMDFVFKDLGNVLRLDYIACWFKKASDYIEKFNSKFSFVSTSSICQGEQVSLIWPYVLSKNLEIFFAYKPFDWENNAKDKAGVTCVIVGLQNINRAIKHIYTKHTRMIVEKIGPYLNQGSDVIMEQRTKAISFFSEMALGSSGIDGGYLMLSVDEKTNFILNNENSKKFIKPFLSGGDFLNGIERFCIWINDEDIDEALQIKDISDRIVKCKTYRQSAGRDAQKAASVPHRFFYRKYKEDTSILIPRTSSGRRKYLPCGFIDKGNIISNQAFVVYDFENYLFSILSSRIHCVWMEITSGKMRHDYSYSVNLTYNTFPFPGITESQKEELTQCVFRILEERENHSEKTLAQMYDPDKMPEGLREAHRLNDLAVERCYRSKPFESNEERLEYLFKLYEKMIVEEKEKGTLFQEEKKAKKSKA